MYGSESGQLRRGNLLKRNMICRLLCAAIFVLSGLTGLGTAAIAQSNSLPAVLTYADLADLADGTELVIRAQIRKQARLAPERAPDVAPGMARLYIEGRTISLIAGRNAVGESLKYLVDVPLGANGKVPKLKKTEVILFARTVANQPGTLRLVRRDSQIAWTPELERRLRPILSALVAQDAPPAILGIRDAFSIPGNLVGESETQIFVQTQDDGPVSLTVIRRPGQSPVWGVSWTDIVDQAARPPEKNTLAWYRLACFLPANLPSQALQSHDRRARQQSEADYAYVRGQLGPCPRNRN